MLVACASATVLAQQATSTTSPASDAQNAAPPAATAPASTAPDRPSFAEWLEQLRAEALAKGIKPAIVQQALDGVTEPVPVVIERDRSQAEIVLPLETYITRQVTAERVRTGREMMARYTDTLTDVSKAYGVPATIIGGIWGMESNYGRFSGVRPTIAALATLAWDPRRGAYFRRELFDALSILNNGDVDVPDLKGSWAGAMGQPQFMPSSYLQFAADFDGDGRRDIWATPADVFASIANYLKGHGWAANESWGREVKFDADAARRVASTVAHRTGSCSALRDMTVPMSLSEWRRLGAKTLGGARVPKDERKASLVSGRTRHFLVYGNYEALLQYNCAHSYALSVALLGDQLGSTAAVVKSPEKAKRPAPAVSRATTHTRNSRTKH